MSQPKLSIVIPVYNSGKYLPECLESILCQDFQDYEVICVDDGSTDGSVDLLDGYAGRDGRFRVLSQMHGGPGTARNHGMAAATGKYLYFMDSDDVLSGENALSFMVGEMESHGLYILCFEARLAFESEKLREQRYREVQFLNFRKEYGEFASGEEMFRELVSMGNFVPSVWLHCIRREFLQREGIAFPGMFRWEDHVFFFQALLLAGKVRHVKEALYIRRVREGSLMTEPETFQYIADALRGWQSMADFLAGRSWKPVTREAVLLHLGRQAQEIEKRYHALPPEEQQAKERLPDAMRSYANMIFMLVPMFRRQMASYLFPYHLFPRGAKVIIYGAGNVGREFYSQAQGCGYVECVGIVDKRADRLKLPGFPVCEPEVIRSMDYNAVLIAVQDAVLAGSVRRDLRILGVPDEKIAWDGPHYLEQDFYGDYYFPLLDKLQKRMVDGKVVL